MVTQLGYLFVIFMLWGCPNPPPNQGPNPMPPPAPPPQTGGSHL
jgi:hypothetical protein